MPPPRKPKSSRVSSGPQPPAAERIVIHGEGGIGKTTLSSLSPKPLIIDLERGSMNVDVDRVTDIESFDGILAALRDDELLSPYETIVVDSGTVAQEMACKHVCDKHGWKSLEEPGYGRGYRPVYEQFNLLIGAMDDVVTKLEKDLILICHTTVAPVPNPRGDDWIQYQIDLFDVGKSCRIRDRVKSWADHVLFMRRDVTVDDRGKATTGGRRVWAAGDHSFQAKTRSLPDSFPVEDGSDALWKALKEKA